MADAANKINAIDLDASLDDMDDLPGFASFPTGAYIVILEKGFELKEINSEKTMEMAMTLKEIMECDASKLDEGEAMPKPGDQGGVLFQLTNAIGAGLFKEAAKPIKAATGATTIREIMEASKGLELLVTIKRQAGKGDQEGRNFMRLVKVAVV